MSVMAARDKKNQVTSSIDPEFSGWLDHMIEPETVEALLADCHDYLENGQDEETFCSMVGSVTGTVDNLWTNIKSDQPDYDCHKGCSWCCHQNVSVTWPELLQILAYLRQTLDKRQLKKLKEKCLKRSEEIAGKSTNQRFDERIACAFLENKICTIHAARPLQCRGGFSEEENYCKDLLENREYTQLAVKDGRQVGKYLIAPKIIYNSAQVAIVHAMKDFGLNGLIFELTVAIAILLRRLSDGNTPAVVEDDLKAASLEKRDDQIRTS